MPDGKQVEEGKEKEEGKLFLILFSSSLIYSFSAYKARRKVVFLASIRLHRLLIFVSFLIKGKKEEDNLMPVKGKNAVMAKTRP